jgi:hypothetical protein
MKLNRLESFILAIIFAIITILTLFAFIKSVLVSGLTYNFTFYVVLFCSLAWISAFFFLARWIIRRKFKNQFFGVLIVILGIIFYFSLAFMEIILKYPKYLLESMFWIFFAFMGFYITLKIYLKKTETKL